MANQFVEQKDRWLKLSENSDFEYALLFIKVWIPFNAWYCNNYPSYKNNDHLILKQVKTDTNLFRTKIVSLISGTDSESMKFKDSLGLLHESLEKNYIPNPDERITFKSLSFRDNPDKTNRCTVRLVDYKAELVTNQNNEVSAVKVMMIDSRTGSNKLNYNHTKYNIDHFKNDADFVKLKPNQIKIVEKCFSAINPKLKESLLTNSKPFILCNETKFVNDPNLLSQAIIQVLYRLRCILFHGEIQPSKDNLSVYEHAYFILRTAIKSLQ